MRSSLTPLRSLVKPLSKEIDTIFIVYLQRICRILISPDLLKDSIFGAKQFRLLEVQLEVHWALVSVHNVDFIDGNWIQGEEINSRESIRMFGQNQFC